MTDQTTSQPAAGRDWLAMPAGQFDAERPPAEPVQGELFDSLGTFPMDFGGAL